MRRTFALTLVVSTTALAACAYPRMGRRPGSDTGAPHSGPSIASASERCSRRGVGGGIAATVGSGGVNATGCNSVSPDTAPDASGGRPPRPMP